MLGEFTVLGIAADPRINGYRPVSSQAVSESAYEYIFAAPDEPGWLPVLVADVDLLGFLIELVFGVLFEL
jgi:hypothetical protein